MVKALKTISLSLSAILTFGAGAFGQSMYDGLKFSENDYTGTARTMAMGNAFTALGGDVGSIVINPAGSAVSNFSQATISTGVTIGVTNSSTQTMPGQPYIGGSKRNISRFDIPNVGLSINFDMHRNSGLKNISIGFTSNRTSSYIDNAYASFSQDATSYSGYMAYLARLSEISKYDLDQNYNPDCYKEQPTDLVLAWNSAIIGCPHGEEYMYVGAAEQYLKDKQGNYNIWLGGPVDQTYARRQLGNKYDYVMNMGFNISDRLYLGANLGFTGFNYSFDDSYTESAQNVYDFPIEDDVYFTDLKYSYYYDAKGSGVYGKFGLIYKPVSNIRLGAAVQTPTSTVITEYWGSNASTYYTYEGYNSSSYTPEGTYKYRLISPMRANFGIAATSKWGLISVDYELCNFKSMRYREINSIDESYFGSVNSDIQNYLGIQHNLRAGVEIKPVSCFSIRAGYGLITSPEKDYDSSYVKANKHSASVGLGYSSKGSFFIDAAVKANIYSSEYVYPYGDYLYDEYDVPMSPEIKINKTLWTALVTLGFRF